MGRRATVEWKWREDLYSEIKRSKYERKDPIKTGFLLLRCYIAICIIEKRWGMTEMDVE